MEYKVVRSKRRTLALEITPNAELIVRVPQKTSINDIERFVDSNLSWISSHMEIAKTRAMRHPEPDEEEKARYIAEAKAYIPDRVAYFSRLMDVTPTSITVTGARKRFGSCSGTNRICFSWRVMEYPKELVDYVIVHELAHIRHHNHSHEFYGFIEKIMPDHRERQKRLKYE